MLFRSQGERPLARDNRTLGRFQLGGIPAAPRGVPQIEVTFDIDANGVVNVSAKDMATGKDQKITITASSGLSKDEVDRMMREAESHADEDKKRREEIETRNRADQAVYAAEKMLADTGDKLPAEHKSGVQTAVDALKAAVSGGDVAAISKAMDELTQVQHKAAEALYKQGAAAPEGDGGAGADAIRAWQLPMTEPVPGLARPSRVCGGKAISGWVPSSNCARLILRAAPF